jgi:hypothetical protein
VGKEVSGGWDEGGPGEFVWHAPDGHAIQLRATCDDANATGTLQASDGEKKPQTVASFPCDAARGGSRGSFAVNAKGEVVFRSSIGVAGEDAGQEVALLLTSAQGVVKVAEKWDVKHPGRIPSWAAPQPAAGASPGVDPVVPGAPPDPTAAELAPCVKALRKVASCADDEKFLAALGGKADTLVALISGPPADHCSEMIMYPGTGQFRGGPDWKDAVVQTRLAAAADKDCASFGTALKVAGGLPAMPLGD